MVAKKRRAYQRIFYGRLETCAVCFFPLFFAVLTDLGRARVMVSQPLSAKELVVAIFSDDSEAVTNASLSFPGAAAVVYIDAKSRARKDKLMYIDLFGLSQGVFDCLLA